MSSLISSAAIFASCKEHVQITAWLYVRYSRVTPNKIRSKWKICLRGVKLFNEFCVQTVLLRVLFYHKYNYKPCTDVDTSDMADIIFIWLCGML